MKKFYLMAVGLMSVFGLSAQNITISTISLSSAPHYNCSTITATINTQVNCINAVHTGNTVTVVGNTVTIDINYTIGPICLGALSFPVQTVALNNLPTGGINLVVNGTWNGPIVSTSTTNFSVIPCCPSTAETGSDTSICDQSQVTLSANTPPSFSTASWSVVSGGATLSSTTLTNPVASNLTYGVNEFVWTMVDSVCTTTDTLVVINSEIPTTPQTEMDRFSCYDTTSIFANVLTVGTATWTAHTPGVSVANIKQPKARVLGLQSGTNVFSYTAENGACILADTLKIDHSTITVQPTISVSGFDLTSSSAPAYQWYLDNIKISGATSQTHTAVAKGEYTVMATEINCDNGLLSDPVEVNYVGIETASKKDLIISPNPSQGLINIHNCVPGSQISIFDVFGKQLINESSVSGSRKTFDISSNENGVYLVRITNNSEIRTYRVLLSK